MPALVVFHLCCGLSHSEIPIITISMSNKLCRILKTNESLTSVLFSLQRLDDLFSGSAKKIWNISEWFSWDWAGLQVNILIQKNKSKLWIVETISLQLQIFLCITIFIFLYRQYYHRTCPSVTRRVSYKKQELTSVYPRFLFLWLLVAHLVMFVVMMDIYYIVCFFTLF
jgi:hypothetical protein